MGPMQGSQFMQVRQGMRGMRVFVCDQNFGVISHYNKGEYSLFRMVNNVHHLKKGVGVAGRAFLSTNMVFCRNVTQLSLTEYPLAHYAQEAGLSGCFAICLQSSFTGNDVCVLEFFMPVSNKARENIHTSLRKILETMRNNFRTFRVASKEELGEELCIEEIDFQIGEKHDSVQMPQTTISLPRLETLQSEGERMQVDSSYQQLNNAINNGSNVISTEHNNITITCTQEKGTGTVKTSKRKGNKSGVKIKISVEDILQASKMSLKDAVKNLKVSKSTLKHVCRDYGIKRWPPHKINKASCSQLNESTPYVEQEQITQLNSDHLPSTQASATIVHTESHDTTMQVVNTVTIKAKYGKDITMKFRLSSSSRFVDLQQEVAKRQDLEAGTYNVKYKDEDSELILMACDDDLQDCMQVPRLPGSTYIMVLIEQKLPITH